MSALHARRKPRSLPSDRQDLRPINPDYDDNRLRAEETLEEMLSGHDLSSRWVDVDEADGSHAERPSELVGEDLVGEDITVPVIAKRADEFTCSSCFLIHHVSRLAGSAGGQLICADCA